MDNHMARSTTGVAGSQRAGVSQGDDLRLHSLLSTPFCTSTSFSSHINFFSNIGLGMLTFLLKKKKMRFLSPFFLCVTCHRNLISFLILLPRRAFCPHFCFWNIKMPTPAPFPCSLSCGTHSCFFYFAGLSLLVSVSEWNKPSAEPGRRGLL